MSTPFSKEHRIAWIDTVNASAHDAAIEVLDRTALPYNHQQLGLIAVHVSAISGYLSVIAECMVRSAK